MKERARRLKTQTHALYLAARDPRTPWLPKLLAAGVVAYALSPIDLIPDFIPVLGYVDDLLLLPLGIWIAIKFVPEPVLADARREAEAAADERLPLSRGAAVAIVTLWVLLVAIVFWRVYLALQRG
jgi:uncharacterized membrane protein YkvA (DUF1232 family)